MLFTQVYSASTKFLKRECYFFLVFALSGGNKFPQAIPQPSPSHREGVQTGKLTTTQGL